MRWTLCVLLLGLPLAGCADQLLSDAPAPTPCGTADERLFDPAGRATALTVETTRLRNGATTQSCLVVSDERSYRELQADEGAANVDFATSRVAVVRAPQACADFRVVAVEHFTTGAVAIRTRADPIDGGRCPDAPAVWGVVLPRNSDHVTHVLLDETR